MLPPGYKLNGRYVIERVLGEGGMGAVYMARQDRIGGKRVAIKEMIVDLHDPQARERAIAQFHKEAEILSSLDHLGLTRVQGHFVEGGAEYLVMDYVDGQTLDSIFHRQRQFLAVDQVLDWISQLCGVLNYLHQHDPPVIFRDLKPSNIMLDSAGRIRLIDFGIARNFDPESKTTTFIKGAGTHGFAPVEQYGTGTTDARSDIYALGATMYVLLTRTLPPPSIAIMSGEERLWHPTQYNPAIPSAIDAVIMRCMQIRKEDRYQTIDDVQRALDEAYIQSTALSMASLQQPCPSCGRALEPGGYCAACSAAAADSVAQTMAVNWRDVSQTPTEVPVAAPQPAPSLPSAPRTTTIGPSSGTDSGIHRAPPFPPPSRKSDSFARNNPAAGQAPPSPPSRKNDAIPPYVPPNRSEPYAPPSRKTESATPYAPPSRKNDSFARNNPSLPAPPVLPGPPSSARPAMPDHTVAVPSNSFADKRLPSMPPRVRPPEPVSDTRRGRAGWSMWAAIAITTALLVGFWYRYTPSDTPAQHGATGVVTIHSTPDGATISVDGQYTYGISPNTISVPSGQHSLRLEKDGYQPVQLSITVPAASPVEVKLSQSRPRLEVDVTPDDVQVQTDGTVRTQHTMSPAVLELSVGHHELVFSKAGYKPAVMAVDVTSPHPQPLHVKLEPDGPQPTLAVETEPAAATVYVDGNRLGQTPFQSSSVKPGQHWIKITHPGYEAFLGQYELTDSHPTRITWKLKPLH